MASNIVVSKQVEAHHKDFILRKTGKFWILMSRDKPKRLTFLDNAIDVVIDDNILIADDNLFEIFKDKEGKFSFRKLEDVSCESDNEWKEEFGEHNFGNPHNTEADKAFDDSSDNRRKSSHRVDREEVDVGNESNFTGLGHQIRGANSIGDFSAYNKRDETDINLGSEDYVTSCSLALTQRKCVSLESSSTEENSNITIEQVTKNTPVDSIDEIERCKKELDARLEKLCTRKIEDYKETVKSLSQEEAKLLDVTALANINVDPQTGVITIDGPTKNVHDAVHELRMALLKIDIKNAEELFKLVQWQYEEVTPTEFKLTPYNVRLNQMIEHAYKANKSNVEFEDDDGDRFVIDFKRLIEYNKSDVHDKVRVLRKDILKSAALVLPEEWAAMKDNENFKVVALPATDQTYKDIENRFITEVKSGPHTHRLNFNPNNLHVNKIERIQNQALYRQYQAKKKQMTEQKPNLPATMPIERDLWHGGTTLDAVISIQMHGFNRSNSGDANGMSRYGEGVHFAGNASYSARGGLPGGTRGKGFMFLVKTLTGQLCKGQKGMRYLPAVDPKDPTVIYDCAVDNLQNQLEFVIFNDTQAYPAYIITFTT